MDELLTLYRQQLKYLDDAEGGLATTPIVAARSDEGTSTAAARNLGGRLCGLDGVARVLLNLDETISKE